MELCIASIKKPCMDNKKTRETWKTQGKQEHVGIVSCGSVGKKIPLFITITVKKFVISQYTCPYTSRIGSLITAYDCL